MATVQLRNPARAGPTTTARRAAGKSTMEAMRCLKRRLSDLVYKTMLDDADRPRRGRAREGTGATTLTPALTGSQPHTGSSDKPHPGPAKTQRRTPIPAAS